MVGVTLGSNFIGPTVKVTCTTLTIIQVKCEKYLLIINKINIIYAYEMWF